jgi:hypothetical protein
MKPMTVNASRFHQMAFTRVSFRYDQLWKDALNLHLARTRLNGRPIIGKVLALVKAVRPKADLW